MYDWLLEHGPTMTRRAAAGEIGYTNPSALGVWADAHMPHDFSFYQRELLFSVPEIIDAIVRQAHGETWRDIARSYGRDHTNLRDYCRRYVRSMSRQYKE
jgi:hypothetical protein